MSTSIKQILLIEDRPADEELFNSLVAELEENKYHINQVGNITEALSAVTTENFAVAILDMSLKDGDGLENITKLHLANPELAIIALSDEFSESLAQDVVNKGAQDYLVKGEVDEWRLLRALKYAIERKHQQDELHFLAHHDELTELANKSLFLIRIEHAVHCARRRGELVALLHLDLDDYNTIVKDLGRQVGDALLIEVANRLTSSIRTVDTVSRIKTDEFTIVIEAIKYIDNVYLVADKIIRKLSEPFTIMGQSLYISASMGVAFYPHFGLETDTLIRNADYAMNQAKNKGGNQYQVYGSADSEPALSS